MPKAFLFIVSYVGLKKTKKAKKNLNFKTQVDKTKERQRKKNDVGLTKTKQRKKFIS